MSRVDPSMEPFLAFLEGDSEGDRLTETMYDAVAKATPVVLANGPADQSALRSALKSHLSVVQRVVRLDDEEPVFSLPPAAEDWARRLAAAEIDLAELVMAYDAAANALWKAFATSMRDGRLPDGERADALEITFDRIFRYLRGALSLAVAAYSAELDVVRRREASMTSDVIASVLAGGMDESQMEAAVGYRLSATHIGFIAWGQNAVLPELNRVLAQMRGAASAWQHVAAPMDHRSVRGWLSTSDPGATLRVLSGLKLPSNVSLALGDPHYGASGFRASFLEASEARRVSLVSEEPAVQRVVAFQDVAVLSLLSQNAELMRDFIRSQLGVLLEPANGTILSTVAVWFEELGSPTRSARRLHVHVNTVVKRLERAESLIGRPIKPTDFVLRVAAEIARSFPSES